MHLPSGVFHQTYAQDHAWWQTGFVRLRMLLLLALLFAYPFIVRIEPLSSIAQIQLPVVIRIGYFILMAMGVQLLIGYTGTITLGHTAFVAVGAYAAAAVLIRVPWPDSIVQSGLLYPLGIVVGIVAGGLWSMLFGLPSARIKGFYTIMTTMAAQFITVDVVITQYVSMTEGRVFSWDIPSSFIRLGPIQLAGNNIAVYYWMLALVSLSVMFMANIARTRVGRAWAAIRDNDIAAEVIGVNVYRYKLAAYFVAGGFGGIAGAFLLSKQPFISQEDFTLTLSLTLVGVILIGGLGSNYGTIFGSIFWVLADSTLTSVVQPLGVAFPQLVPTYFREMGFGLAIILFLIFEPNGLAYRWWQIKNYIHLWPFSY
jgi:branched-chain amino acid transport system permease protein